MMREDGGDEGLESALGGDRRQVSRDECGPRRGIAARDSAFDAARVWSTETATVFEARAALEAAKAAGFATIVSARSGETEDVTIAHLAIGWDAGQIKVGSFARSERMAKWNECLRIEEALGKDAVFAGRSVLALGAARAAGADP